MRIDGCTALVVGAPPALAGEVARRLQRRGATVTSRPMPTDSWDQTPGVADSAALAALATDSDIVVVSVDGPSAADTLRVVVPALARRDDGRLVAVALQGSPAVTLLVEELRRDLAPTGVGLSTVVPRPAVPLGLWPEVRHCPRAPAASHWAAARATVVAIERDRDEVRPAVPAVPAARDECGLSAGLVERLLRPSDPPVTAGVGRRGARVC